MATRKSRSPDRIRAVVTRIAEADSFDGQIIYQKRGNGYPYSTHETFRFRRFNPPSLDEPGGLGAKRYMERELLGKEIEANVFSRDQYHRLVVEITAARKRPAVAIPVCRLPRKEPSVLQGFLVGAAIGCVIGRAVSAIQEHFGRS